MRAFLRPALSTLVAVGLIAACSDNGEVAPPEPSLDAGHDARADVDRRETSASEGGEVDAADAGGDANAADASDAGDGGVLPTGIFASAVTGDDANPGTSTSPVKTIQKAMTIAQGLGGAQTIILGEGEYRQEDNLALVEGISLSGGYVCNATSCPWTRDAVNHASKVDFFKPAADAEGSAHGAKGIVAGGTITRQTRIEYLEIVARQGLSDVGTGNGNCITIEGGAPAIANDKLELDDAALNNGGVIGINIVSTGSPAGPLIVDNDILGGHGYSSAIGIQIATGAKAEILGNRISGQVAIRSSTKVVGVSGAGAGTVLRGNEILNGDGSAPLLAGDPGLGSAYALEISGAAIVDGNRFNTKTAAACARGICCAINVTGSGATITNNIVLGPPSLNSCGINFSSQSAAAPTVLNANYIEGGGNPAASIGTDTNQSRAIVLASAAGLRIRNNIIVGGKGVNRYGIYQTGAETPDKLEADDFFFATQGGTTDVMYRWSDGSSLNTVGAIQSTVTTSTPPSGLLAVDPQVDATYHLNAGSPMINAGVAADAPAKDIDGDTRPQGSAVDIGADER